MCRTRFFTYRTPCTHPGFWSTVQYCEHWSTCVTKQVEKPDVQLWEMCDTCTRMYPTQARELREREREVRRKEREETGWGRWEVHEIGEDVQEMKEEAQEMGQDVEGKVEEEDGNGLGDVPAHGDGEAKDDNDPGVEDMRNSRGEMEEPEGEDGRDEGDGDERRLDEDDTNDEDKDHQGNKENRSSGKRKSLDDGIDAFRKRVKKQVGWSEGV